MQGRYNNGATCGRWMKIKLGKNCAGGRNTDHEVCLGGSTHVVV